MSKSSWNRGPAWSVRSDAAIRPGTPGLASASLDIVCATSHSRTNTFHSGIASTTRGAMPVSDAARVLYSSLLRSTASRSVVSPGMRTKNGVPSTSTR